MEKWHAGEASKADGKFLFYFSFQLLSFFGCKRINGALIYIRVSMGRVHSVDNLAGALILRRVAVSEHLKQGLRRLIMRANITMVHLMKR